MTNEQSLVNLAKDRLSNWGTRSPASPAVVTQLKHFNIRPDTAIILCTGYSEKFSEMEAHKIGIKRFAMKPVNMHILATIIREVLADAFYKAINMKIEYEKAKLPDYEEIHTVMQTSAREISRKAYSKELVGTFDKFYIDKTKDYIKQTLENPDNQTIVAKDKNRIIGFIQLKVNKQKATISHLYILPDYKGNSVGTQLFNLIKEQAVQLNVAKLMIESTLNALTYYERLGFVNNGFISDGSAYDLELQLECV